MTRKNFRLISIALVGALLIGLAIGPAQRVAAQGPKGPISGSPCVQGEPDQGWLFCSTLGVWLPADSELNQQYRPHTSAAVPAPATWAPAAPAAWPPPAAAAPAVPAPVASSTVYTVQQDDTLGEIATRLGVSLALLIQANGISNPNLIYVGQRLTTVPGASAAPAPAAPAPWAPAAPPVPAATWAPTSAPAERDCKDDFAGYLAGRNNYCADGGQSPAPAPGTQVAPESGGGNGIPWTEGVREATGGVYATLDSAARAIAGFAGRNGIKVLVGSASTGGLIWLIAATAANATAASAAGYTFIVGAGTYVIGAVLVVVTLVCVVWSALTGYNYVPPASVTTGPAARRDEALC